MVSGWTNLLPWVWTIALSLYGLKPRSTWTPAAQERSKPQAPALAQQVRICYHHAKSCKLLTWFGCYCRFLKRPYGRVDRPKLKHKLLTRCAENGMLLYAFSTQGHWFARSMIAQTPSHPKKNFVAPCPSVILYMLSCVGAAPYSWFYAILKAVASGQHCYANIMQSVFCRSDVSQRLGRLCQPYGWYLMHALP